MAGAAFVRFGDLIKKTAGSDFGSNFLGGLTGGFALPDNANGICKDPNNVANNLSSGAQSVAIFANLHPVASIAVNPAAMFLTGYKVSRDIKTNSVSSGDILSITGNIIGTIGTVGALAAVGTVAAASVPAIVATSAILGTVLGLTGFWMNNWGNGNKPTFCQWQDDLAPHRQPTAQVHDPLILDLDGDGIETIAMNGLSGSLFDHNNNGLRIATGWAGKDDGMLVRDLNGNGTIDNALELMSDKTRLANGETAAHGYEALADLDSNQDGKVDAADEAFGSLKIWQDKNQDGISQADELHTLESLGIQQA